MEKEAPLPNAETDLAPGAIVTLHGAEDMQFVCVLCAHVHADTWLVHKAVPTDGAHDGDDGAALCAEGLQEAEVPVGKERTNDSDEALSATTSLRQTMEAHPAAWQRVVAEATFQAEVLRRARLQRAFDTKEASQGFERNPFRWGGRDNITFLVKWLTPSGSSCAPSHGIAEHPQAR